jgi:hypothetical protein
MTQYIVQHSSTLAQYKYTKHKSSRRRAVAVATALTFIGSSHVQNGIGDVASDRRRRGSLQDINGRVRESFDIGSNYEYKN